MVVKVARNQWNIQVAALANRFAVVHCLQDRQPPRMFLHLPSQSVQIASPRVRCKRLPFRKRPARRFHRRIDVRRRTLRNRRQAFARRRVERVEINALSRRPKRAADEVAKLAPMLVQPHQRFARILRRRTVFHRKKFFGDTHALLSVPQSSLPAVKSVTQSLTRSDAGTPPNTCPSREIPTGARCRPASS